MKAFPLILAASLLLANYSHSREYGSVQVTTVTTIYDGDTFTATVEGWPDIIGKRIGVRVAGIDTPELRGKCRAEIEQARAAKQFTVATLRAAKSIELRNMQRDKYFRIVAQVYADGENLGHKLIARNLAVPYAGGTKISWCK